MLVHTTNFLRQHHAKMAMLTVKTKMNETSTI